MTSYSELMAQAQALIAQAEQARKNELASVIADIKAKMKKYDIDVAALGVASARKSGKSKSTAAAKYRSPNGELWVRGPGRKPGWLRDAIAEGKNIEDFRI